MAAPTLCDMCQEADFDVSQVIRANGQTVWLCWACNPYAQAAYLQNLGWSVEPPQAKTEQTEQPAPEEEATAGKPRRRPRVVKNETEPPEGTAHPEGVETPAAGADDHGGDDRLEARGGDGGDPGAGAPGA